MASETSEPNAPLVSIICRTMGRPELREALASAAGQTHAPIEIILVDAAARGEAACRKDCAEIPVVLALPDAPLSRPAAANFGLECATGDYLLILDEDDWLAPEHVAGLLDFLGGQQKIRAAYSSTRKTDAAGEATVETFGQPFDRLLLMRDNYIPIHSMLFARSLLDGGDCRFDENFDVFEDWDFWLQLSEHGEFRHIEQYTAFYRAGGASGTADLDDHLQRFDPEHELGKARNAVYNKWLKHWSGEQLNALLGAGQREWAQSVARIDELGRELDRIAQTKRNAEKQVVDLHHERADLHRRIGQTIEERNEARHAHKAMEARLNAMIHKLQQANSRLHDAVRELRSNLASMLGSRSWKMTHAYRAMGRWLASLSGKDLPPPLSVESLMDAPVASSQSENPQQTENSAEAESAQGKKPARGRESGQFKATFDREAEQALAGFFANGEKLALPVSGPPALSVLLVFFNQAHLSLLCLKKLIENADVPFELIIVDNASSDDTGKLLDRLENVKLIRNDENLGFVKAVNQGAVLAEAQYLLLLNNDAFIEPGALGAALATLREEADAGAVGGRIHLLDGSLQEAGNIIWRDGSCIGYGRGGDPEDGEFRFRREVDYCSGAFLMFATARFRELGGFDEAFAPAYYEESDFCLRLRRAGQRVIFEPRAVVRHYEFASTGSLNAAAALQEKNRARFRDKHREFLQGQPEADPRRAIHRRTANSHHNLLLIDDAVPHESLGSGYPRCRHIVSLLARMPLNVSFYPLQLPVDDWGEVYRTVPHNVEVLLNRGRSGLAELLRERAGFYRYVMVSRPTNMALFNAALDTLPEEARQFEIIYDAEAVFAGRELLWRELQGEFIDAEEKRRVVSTELALARRAATVITVSEAEAELFRKEGRERVFVLGHGLEPIAETAAFDGRRGLLFVGALKQEHSPNVDSLLWFACNALPLIEREIPEIALYVAGNTGAPSLNSIERPGIQFRGRVESLDAMYRECRVFIAPTRFAAGIPHKVHEATAHGIPAVVTPLLARQLGWRHEQEVLIGEDPESFAAQCLRLYRDASLWEQISKSAREAVARDCSPERFQRTLEAVIG